MKMTSVLERPMVEHLPEADGPPHIPLSDPTTGFGGNRYHVGRSWVVAGPSEADCPCHKAPCGLVDEIDEFCTEHGMVFGNTMRANHHERDCPMANS